MNIFKIIHITHQIDRHAQIVLLVLLLLRFRLNGRLGRRNPLWFWRSIPVDRLLRWVLGARGFTVARMFGGMGCRFDRSSAFLTTWRLFALSLLSQMSDGAIGGFVAGLYDGRLKIVYMFFGLLIDLCGFKLTTGLAWLYTLCLPLYTREECRWIA